MLSTFFLGTVDKSKENKDTSAKENNTLHNEPTDEGCRKKYAPVLIIEDNVVNHRVMKFNLMKRLNLKETDFYWAQTAEAAIRFVKEEGKRFKLYVVDHHLQLDESPGSFHTTGEYALNSISAFLKKKQEPLGFSIKWTSDEKQANTKANIRISKQLSATELDLALKLFVASLESKPQQLMSKSVQSEVCVSEKGRFEYR